MAAKDRATLNSDADSNLPDNSAGAISPADVRGAVKDIVESAFNLEDDDSDDIPEGATNLYHTAARVGSAIHGATGKTTPVDADELGLIDSAASNVLKKLTWTNLKDTLKTYFDTLYQAAGSYLTASGTATLTNKRVTARVGSTTSSATPTINTDDYDVYRITALTVNITSMTTNLSGTPTHGQRLVIEITGTATRTIAWGSSFEDGATTLPTTTDGTTMLAVGFFWNSATSKWRCMAAG